MFATISKMELPSYTGRLYLVGYDYIVRPNVVLPLARSHDAADDAARVNANSHVDVDLSRYSNLADIADHSQAQLNAVFSVSFVFDRQTRNAVIAVAEKFNPQHVVFL